EWNNSLKTKLSLLPKKLFRIRMSRNFGMKMLTMTNLSTECLIQLTKLGYDATPFNQILKQNAKREMRFQSAAFSSGKVRPNHETNINIIARRTGKDVNSHTVLDGIITTIMATIQRINIIGSREGSRNRRRLKANQTGKKF